MNYISFSIAFGLFLISNIGLIYKVGKLEKEVHQLMLKLRERQ